MSEITPALTAEEWTEMRVSEDRDFYLVRDEGDGLSLHISGDLEDKAVLMAHGFHATAALCLYNQPFGFTREDVATVLETIGSHDWENFAEDYVKEFAGRLRHLAARIAALLPASSP